MGANAIVWRTKSKRERKESEFNKETSVWESIYEMQNEWIKWELQSTFIHTW